jgi:ABC-type antimicrobial peptide transport system permease subunit
VLRFVFTHLRRRPGRAAALVLGVLIATTGFTVLTASTVSSHLTVLSAIRQGSQAPYQILVRPVGARTALEQQRGLVRPNFLAGRYGGISDAQWAAIKRIPGVSVAAPIAMAGYALTSVGVPVDLTGQVDPGLTRQVLRVQATWHADRGTTSAVDPAAGYVYITRRPVLWPKLLPGQTFQPAFPRAGNCSYGPAPYEVEPNGKRVPLCMSSAANSDVDTRAPDMVVQVLPDGTFMTMFAAHPSTRLVYTFDAPTSLLVAAIDPASEAALVGLSQSVVSGRYLSAADGVSQLTVAGTEGAKASVAPVLVTAQANVDESVSALVARDSSVAADSAPAKLSDAALGRGRLALLAAGPATSIGAAYQQLIRPADGRGYSIGNPLPVLLTELVQSGEPQYDVLPDGTLRPQAQPPAADALTGSHRPAGWFSTSPWLSTDAGFRSMRLLMLHSEPPGPAQLIYVEESGVFQPAKISVSDPLTMVPLETYQPVEASGATAATSTLLHGQPLLPSDNLGGYLATAPSVLITLKAWQQIAGGTAPISAIRVRVAGASGYDAVSLARVQLVAQQISQRTGLNVDIVLGSSPAPETVALAPGNYGRPQLTLTEPWSKLNVATMLVSAVNQKSTLVLTLILVVCALFIGNAVAAAVHDRRGELAVLACLGWPAAHILAALLAEVAALGLVAGVAAAVISMPLGHALGTTVTLYQVLLAVPIAIAVALVAGGAPAIRGSRAHPGSALSRPAARPRRAKGPRRGSRQSVGRLAVRNLRRAPGRAVLGAFALSAGVCALTLLLVLQWAFQGAAVGSVLGDAVAVQVTGADTIAVVTIVALGVLAVIDVLYLNIRDRASEFAVLHAVGWPATALGRLVGYEGLALGLAGSLAGAAAGLTAALAFAGPAAQASDVVRTAALAVVIGTVLACAAAAVPALLLRRLVPIDALLSEE